MAGRHVCYLVDDDIALVETAARFIDEHAAAGMRPLVIARDDLAADVRRAPVIAHRDDVDVVPADALFGPSRAFDAVTTLAAYADRVERALDDGYRGLAVVADVSPIMADAAARATFLRFEAQADRLMRDRPLVALCAYERRRLPPGYLDAVAAVHPVTRNGRSPGFRVAYDAGAIWVEGEIDRFGAAAFDAALRAHDDAATDVVVDLAGVTFIDHHGLLALREVWTELRRSRRRVRLARVPPVVRRLAEVLQVRIPC